MAYCERDHVLDVEMQKYVSGRTQLDGQRNENLSVKEVRRKMLISYMKRWWLFQEMDLLGDDAKIFKMMGPVLVQQELSESKQTVSKRLEYITKEMWAL